MPFSYMRPDEMMTLPSSVVGGAATGYTDDWLTDGRPGRPAKTTQNTPPWIVVAPVAKEIGAIVVSHHNLDGGLPIVISGPVVASLTAPAVLPNSITLNPWAVPGSIVTANSFTVAINSNSRPIVIGEVFAGKLRQNRFNLQLRSVGVEIGSLVELPTASHSALPGYDEGVETRALSGVFRANSADYANLTAWYRSTNGGTRPSVVIPDTAAQDAWIVRFTGFRARPISYTHWEVSVGFVEYPRTRW